MTATSSTAAKTAAINYSKPGDRLKDVLEYLRMTDPSADPQVLAAAAVLMTSAPVAPYHEEDVRVSPNELLRSGLFRVADSRRKREYCQRERLPLQASRGGYIEYTGQELRQDDCAVFLELLRLEQATPGVAVVPLRRTAEALGWGTSNAAVNKLEDSIIRMSASNVEINVNKPLGSNGAVMPVKIGISLVSAYKSVKRGEWVVYLPQGIRGLCHGNRYTKVVQAYVEKLNKGASLASWLLRFYSTHREPMPLTYEQLQMYCGARSEPKEFKRMAKEALEQLKAVGFLLSVKAGAQDVSVVRSRVLQDELAEVAE